MENFCKYIIDFQLLFGNIRWAHMLNNVCFDLNSDNSIPVRRDQSELR